MSRLYTTGPVENGAGNSALSVLTKVLNNNTQGNATAIVTLFNLEGTKQSVNQVTLSVPPLRTDFASFQANTLNEYEIQIEVDRDENVLVSVWGLDADANLIAAQRFVHNELKEYTIATSQKGMNVPIRKRRKKIR
jgi:hypothetical protein